MTRTAKICWVADLGLIPYAAASDLQHQLVEARKAGAIPDVLLLCEHPHVITLGRNGHREHLRASQHLLAQMNVEFHPTDRGGDITYHGPGQIVGYPILDLAEHRRDIRWYVDGLEEVMIRASADLGVTARRREGCRGVWIDAPRTRPLTGAPVAEEKLGALGVHLSRWVSSHGFAYNVSTDLRFYDLIVPCGIVDKGVTSLERILGRAVSPEQVAPTLISHFASVFNCRMETLSRNALAGALAAHAAGTGVINHGVATLVEQS